MTPAAETDRRKKVLIRLQHELNVQEEVVWDALYADFKKPAFEGLVTETALVQSELRYTINHMQKWSRPKMVWPSWANFPSLDYVYRDPYGKVLIIAPWNYPFHLALYPLIAAYAAGNQVVLKPSELTPHTSAVIADIVGKVFDQSEVEVIEGGVDVATALLEKRWDYIFFTGSVTVGKIVAKAAAAHLTPVTLELGGKCPCIVDETAALELAAKRIVWGKFLNAGQTCVAPDYLLVHVSVKEQLVHYLINEINAAYGENPQASPDLARIVNQKNWHRLQQLLQGQKILAGGHGDESELYIAPTLIDEPSVDSALMREEIFGPLLPILSYREESDIDAQLSRFEKPLALYVFSTDKNFYEKCLSKQAFGGGCLNDVAVHLANRNLPFGGVGHSGIGAYHGKSSFDTFTHRKSVVKKGNWLDIPLRYAPYKDKLPWVKKLLPWL